MRHESYLYEVDLNKLTLRTSKNHLYVLGFVLWVGIYLSVLGYCFRIQLTVPGYFQITFSMCTGVLLSYQTRYTRLFSDHFHLSVLGYCCCICLTVLGYFHVSLLLYSTCCFYLIVLGHHTSIHARNGQEKYKVLRERTTLTICIYNTGRERLIRSHSSARFSFELSGNSNELTVHFKHEMLGKW